METLMETRVKTFYVRHPDTNQSFGMVAYKTSPCFDQKGVCTGELFITYAFSFCHPRDKFTKKMAHAIAEGRLEKGGTYAMASPTAKVNHKDILLAIIKNPTNHVPQSIRATIAHLLGSCIQFSEPLLKMASTPIYPNDSEKINRDALINSVGLKI